MLRVVVDIKAVLALGVLDEVNAKALLVAGDDKALFV